MELLNCFLVLAFGDSKEIIGFIVKSVEFCIDEAFFGLVYLVFLEKFPALVDEALVAVVVLVQVLFTTEIGVVQHGTVVFQELPEIELVIAHETFVIELHVAGLVDGDVLVLLFGVIWI